MLTATVLRERRLALGLSQRALAERLGVSTNTVARWERDEIAIAHPAMVDQMLQQIETQWRMEHMEIYTSTEIPYYWIVAPVTLPDGLITCRAVPANDRHQPARMLHLAASTLRRAASLPEFERLAILAA